MDLDITAAPRLVLCFGMKGCPSCEAFIPVLRDVSQRHPDVPTFAVDCDKQAEAASFYKISATPTTFLLARGRPVARLEGAQDAATVEKLFAKAEGLPR